MQDGKSGCGSRPTRIWQPTSTTWRIGGVWPADGTIAPQNAVRQNACSQAAPAAHGFFRSRAKRGVHPVTGAALGRAAEADALKGELAPNQAVQIDSACDHVATKHSGVLVVDAQTAAEVFVNLPSKKSDLALVVVLVMEIAVAADAGAGHALDGLQPDGGLLAGRPSMVPFEVVCR